MRWMGLFVVPALVFSGVAWAGELPTKDEVLGRFVEAVGGKEALLAQEPLCYAGMIIQDLSWKEPQHTEVPFRACGNQQGELYYVESADWADLPTVDSGEPRAKLRWVMHPAFALLVEEFFPDLEVMGTRERDGRQMIVLAPQGLKFENYALYFDRETGRLNHIGYHNELKDWRPVEGVLRPHAIVFGRKGGHTTYRFEEFGREIVPE